MARTISLDHDAFSREMRKYGVAMPATPKKSSHLQLAQKAQSKSRPKPLATLLGQLENQLICSSPYARRRGVPASPAKLRRAGFCSPAVVKAKPVKVAPLADPPRPTNGARGTMKGDGCGLGADSVSGGHGGRGIRGRDDAAPPDVAVLKPHVRKQVLSLFDTWAAQNDDGQPLRISSSTLTRPASCNALLGRREHGRSATSTALPSLAGPPARQRASSASVRSNIGTSEANDESTAKTSALSFDKVLRLYFRHADDKERQAMLHLVAPHVTQLGKKRWIRRIKKEHTDKIRMAFLMGDTDGNGTLSLTEFAEAIAVHRGERPGGRAEPLPESHAISPEELAQIFADGDKDGNNQLDLDEFLELVASHPKLMNSFEDVLSVAVQKKRDAEQARLTKIFKCAISPTSRAIASPSGMRRRPTLADLKAMHEVKLPDDWEG